MSQFVVHRKSVRPKRSWARWLCAVVVIGATAWCVEARAGGFGNYYYHRSSQTGRVFYFGNSYGYGNYSSVIGNYGPRGGYTIGSGGGNGRFYNHYSYQRRR